MIAVLSVIFLSIIFVIIDLIPLYQNEEWVSFFLSVSLLVVALILAVLIELKIEIPIPSDYIERVVTFIFGIE
jgi:hypothetical protein